MRALNAEWRKIATLPGARLTVLLTVALTVALALASGRANADMDVRLSQVAGWAMMYVQAGFVVLGALTAASEYVGGQHRTSLLAMPRRGAQSGAKVMAFAVAALMMAVVVQAASLLGYWLGMDRPIVNDKGELIRNLAGSGLVGVLLALLAWGLGHVTRSAMAAMAPLLGLCLFAAPMLMRYAAWAKYLPGNAGSTLIIYQPGPEIGPGLPGLLEPATGGLVLAAWAAVACTAGAACLIRRDA